MTESDSKEVLTAFSRVARGFGEWRDRTLKMLAAQNGTTPHVEAAAMRASWHAALRTFDNDEVAEVLEGIESGAIPTPTFGEAHRAIASAVRDNRNGRREAERRDREREPSYKCLSCRDTGLVEVVNPHFAEWFRESFNAFEHGGWPPNWHGEAYRDWRRQGRGPMLHSALCRCDSPRVAMMRAERQLFVSNNRRLNKVQLAEPACGMADYDQRTMPLIEGVAFIKGTLRAWYAEHAPNAIYEWQIG